MAHFPLSIHMPFPLFIYLIFRMDVRDWQSLVLLHSGRALTGRGFDGMGNQLTGYFPCFFNIWDKHYKGDGYQDICTCYHGQAPA